MRNTMTVHLPADRYFRAHVVDGTLRVESVTFGAREADPDMDQTERRVTVAGRVVRSGDGTTGVNQRSGSIPVSRIPAHVATYILSTLM